MATTTPNSGWVVPTSSDLVKDGAVAIETLGDSIDASLLDLRGGTVGQALVKASATQMDFAWVSTPSASNPILNSAFNVWQRGTSIAVPAATAAYAADRFQVYNAGASEALTISRQATSDTTNLPFIQYCTRFQRNSGQTGTTLTQYGQTLESVNSIPFAGKAVTFSFYARKGADFSAASSTLNAKVTTGTGTDQNVFTGFTGGTSPINSTATLTTTWQRFTFTGTIAATATQLGLEVSYTPVGTAGTNDYYEVTGFQLDISSVALPYRTAGTTYQAELAMCQRYLPVLNASAKVLGFASSTTQTFITFPFVVQPRVAPTGITTAAMANYNLVNASLSVGTPTSINFSSANLDSAFIGVVTTAGSPTLVSGQADYLAAGASGQILFTGCEL